MCLNENILAIYVVCVVITLPLFMDCLLYLPKSIDTFDIGANGTSSKIYCGLFSEFYDLIALFASFTAHASAQRPIQNNHHG